MLRRMALAAVFAVLGGLGAALGGAPDARAQGNDPSFRVINNSRFVVERVFAAPASERNWGDDRLGQNTIAPGANTIIRLPPGDCVYDIRVVYQGRLSEEWRQVNTCNLTDVRLPIVSNATVQAGTAPSPNPNQQARPGAGPTGNPSFNLVNQSGRTIESFYASPASASEWGEDRLGNDVVRPGQTMAIRLPQGECTYDLRAVFEGGGQPQDRRGVNLCQLDNYVVR